MERSTFCIFINAGCFVNPGTVGESFRRKVLYLFYGLNIIMLGNIVIFEKQPTEVHVTKIAPLVITMFPQTMRPYTLVYGPVRE